MSKSRSRLFPSALFVIAAAAQASACAGNPFRHGPPAEAGMAQGLPPSTAVPSDGSSCQSPPPVGTLSPTPKTTDKPGVLKLPSKDGPTASDPEPTKVPETEPEDYVTDIRLWSDQMTEDGIVPLAKNAPNPTKILATAAMGLPNGDYFEVGGYFDWHSDASERATVGGMMGPQDNVAIAFGHWDLFDSGGTTEPITRIRTCVHNPCQASEPSCPAMVCAETHAAGVINLEGAWIADGGGFSGDTVLLTQDGRLIGDLDGSLKHGHVLHKTVSFDRYDVHYEGVLAWDRSHIEGLAWETMTLTSMGTWSATRTVSPLPFGSSDPRRRPPCAGFSFGGIP